MNPAPIRPGGTSLAALGHLPEFPPRVGGAGTPAVPAGRTPAALRQSPGSLQTTPHRQEPERADTEFTLETSAVTMAELDGDCQA
jgi:hypothetical protein